MLSQIRADLPTDNGIFLKPQSTLTFDDAVRLKVSAKLDHADAGWFCQGKTVEEFSLKLSVHDEHTDTYVERCVIDLLEQASYVALWEGEEITVNLGRDETVRWRACKLTVVLRAGDTVEQMDYYYTIGW